MSKKIALTAAAFLLLFGSPSAASAAGIGVFQTGFTIVPEQCQSKCPCGEAAVLQAIQNITSLVISFAIVILIFFIVWAGFSFVLSPTSEEARSHAKKMLSYALIGMLLVLSAWLIVDFVIKTLAGGDTAFGPWNKILQFEGDTCVLTQPTRKIEGLPGVFGAVVNTVAEGGGTYSSGTGGVQSGGYGGGGFSYNPGVSAEVPAESAALSSMLSCMSSKVPSGVTITALTDLYTTTNASRISHCAAVGHQGDANCVHTVHSCHYGGRSCVGASHAVDFGINHSSEIIAAAYACGSPSARVENGNHVHANAPDTGSCGCN